MPDRIEVYQPQIAVDNVPQFTPQLQDVTDPGQAITNVGRSLLANAEPFVQDHVDNAAMHDAGAAEIIKGPDGQFMRPLMPKGAGLRYSQLYDRVMDNRLIDLTTKSLENQLNVLGGTHSHDPQGFMNEATALAEGTLKAVDPRIRAQVESNFTREISERFRGITNLKASNDWTATSEGLRMSATSHVAAAADILQQGGPDAASRAMFELNKAGGNVDDLQKMGEFSPLGADAFKRNIVTQLGDPIRFRQSADNFVQLGPQMQGMDNPTLARVALFAAGTTDGGKVKVGNKELDYQQFVEMFPSEEIRRRVGSVAGNALNARIEAQRAAEADARAAQSHEDANRVIGAVKAINADPVNGYSVDQVAKFEADYASHGSAHDQMQTPDGVQRTIQYAATYGSLPTGVKEYVEGQVAGNNFPAVSAFIKQVRQLNSHDAWVGERIFNQLDPKTRTLIEYDDAMTRVGIPLPNRQVRIDQLNRSQMPSYDDVQASYHPIFVNGKSDGRTYSVQRNEALSKVLGVGTGQVETSTIALRDFDRLLPYNYQLYPNDHARALKVTAEQVARGWQSNKFFLGGIAPRDVTSSWQQWGVKVDDLNAEIAARTSKSQNPNGYNFSGQNGGYARLRPLFDDAGKGYGEYQVEFYTNDGRAVGAAWVDMDAVMHRIKQRADTRRNQVQQQAKVEGQKQAQHDSANIDTQRKAGMIPSNVPY